MTKAPRRRRFSEAATRRSSPASYSVGYSKPPSKHRFKPGQSGNPRGRPKGTKNTATVLRKFWIARWRCASAAYVRKVSVREAMLMRFAEAGLKGDTKAAGFLLQRYDMEETVNEHGTDATTQDELEIIEAYHAKPR